MNFYNKLHSLRNMNSKEERWEIKYCLMILEILMIKSKILPCSKIKCKKRRKKKTNIIIFHSWDQTWLKILETK